MSQYRRHDPRRPIVKTLGHTEPGATISTPLSASGGTDSLADAS